MPTGGATMRNDNEKYKQTKCKNLVFFFSSMQSRNDVWGSFSSAVSVRMQGFAPTRCTAQTDTYETHSHRWRFIACQHQDDQQQVSHVNKQLHPHFSQKLQSTVAHRTKTCQSVRNQRPVDTVSFVRGIRTVSPGM